MTNDSLIESLWKEHRRVYRTDISQYEFTQLYHAILNAQHTQPGDEYPAKVVFNSTNEQGGDTNADVFLESRQRTGRPGVGVTDYALEQIKHETRRDMYGTKRILPVSPSDISNTPGVSEGVAAGEVSRMVEPASPANASVPDAKGLRTAIYSCIPIEVSPKRSAEATEDIIKALRPYLAKPQKKVLLGDIAHLLTGVCNATCCYCTGGYGGELMHPDCDCRETAKATLDHLEIPYEE